ncbi:protein-disulfide reductase DsbD family protein [Desulfomonile tiedjei]|uniref:Thiol:disulfide interchange protein n=1 Tax=Desulfomonile tiedjei (strain ATCC 49306 / DSM 6799 / DCB-1) TaxID=706587 RepID=I4C8Q2_DESTA|nr:cytochrome c biogenesis protein CcdA [Desulfomonile tiedjei]AFM25943.1 thiol:disulfide interchange protein [Desulfomonile tiedjei DSM 6799]
MWIRKPLLRFLAIVLIGGTVSFLPLIFTSSTFATSAWHNGITEADHAGKRFAHVDSPMPPAELDLRSSVTIVAADETAKNAKPKGSARPYGLTVLWALLAVFVGGMALNLTPCVYPLIPVTIAFFGGRTEQGRGKLAIHAALYIIGLSITNSLLGVIAALTGNILGSALQNPFVLSAVAVILLAFAASLFGLWEFQLPERLRNSASKSYAGYFGSFFMGLTLGVVAAPCLGPFVVGLLTWVAAMGSPWMGFLVFFVLSLGLGVPLFVLAMFSGALEKLPGSGAWMLWVRKLMGWVLIAMAVYFVRPLFPEWIADITLAAVVIAAGVYLGWIDRTEAGFRQFEFVKKTVGVVCVGAAIYFVSTSFTTRPGIVWQPYSATLIEQAQKSNKPVMVDFSAAWCGPCKQLKKVTFTDPAVVRQAQNFMTLEVDLTSAEDLSIRKLAKDFSIKGVPTVVFFDKEGRERADLRLEGFVPPKKFLATMEQVTGSGS